MSDVLDFFRQKESRFENVPDGELTIFIGREHPEFLKNEQFDKDFGRVVTGQSLRQEQASLNAEPQPSTATEFLGEIQKPLIPITETAPIPKAPEDASILQKAETGLLRGGEQLLESATSPLGVSILAASALPGVGPVVQKLAAAGFGTQAALQGTKQIYEAAKVGDVEGAAEGLVSLGAGAGMLATLKPKAILIPKTEEALKTTSGAKPPPLPEQPKLAPETPPPLPQQPVVQSQGELSAVPIPGLKQFVEQDVVPTAAEVVQGVKKTAAAVESALSPATKSEPSQIGAGIVREHNADLARKDLIARKALEGAKASFDELGPAGSLDFIDKMESGAAQATPEADVIASHLRDAFDDRLAQVRALGTGKLQQAIQDYFPHIWKDPKAATDWYGKIFGKRPLEGPKSFLKKRTIPTTADGIAAGLQPVSTNPVDLTLLKLHEIDRYLMGQRIMAEYKDNGLAKFVRVTQKPPADMVKIDDRVAQVTGGISAQGALVLRGHYYAPADAARIINNFLSPGLKGQPWFDAMRWSGNLMNQAQLGLSAFHMTFTAIDSATSSLALGLQKIAEGGTRNIAKGLLDAGKSAIPIYAPIENFIKSNKFLKEYYKPGSQAGTIGELVDAFQAAGGRVKMDQFYSNSAAGNFVKAWRSGNYPGAILRSPFALIDVFAKPLMEIMVPRMKIGIFMDMAKFELEKMTPAQRGDRNYVRHTLGGVWDSVDNRMGQLVYDNLFWSKTLKDMAFIGVRSVGWNLGTFRELGGAVVDTAKRLERAGTARQTEPMLSRKMAYAAALTMVTSLYGAMYQYLRTGKGPEDKRDYPMPRTGRINPDGTEERVMLPTYFKDIAPLVVAGQHSGPGGVVSRAALTATHKLHPLLSSISQMLDNKDFYGNEIVNRDDPLVSKLYDEAKFIGKQFVSFSVRNVQQRSDDTKETIAESFLGILPASKELMRTKAEQMMVDYVRSKIPTGAATHEQAERKDIKKDLLMRAQKGEDIAEGLIQQVEDGKMSRSQARRIFSDSFIEPRIRLFKRLSVDEAQRVLDASTSTERELFEPYFDAKMRNAAKSGNLIEKP